MIQVTQSKAKQFVIVLGLILFGFFASVFIHYILSQYLGRIEYSTFLFDPKDRFRDFINPIEYARQLNPYLQEQVSPDRNYFPFAYVITYLFSWLPADFSVLILFIVYFSFLYYLAKRTFLNKVEYRQYGAILPWSFLGAVAFSTYASLFALDRANFDLFIFGFLVWFAVWYLEGHRFSWLPLSFAAASKLLPAYFAILYLKRKDWRSFCLTTLSAIFLTCLSLLVFKGSVHQNVTRLLKNLSEYNEVYGIFGLGSRYHHSLYDLIKSAISVVGFNTEQDARILMRFYVPFAALLGLIPCWLVWKGKYSDDQSILALTCSLLLFPQVSADYRLIFLFIPLFLYFGSEHEGDFKAMLLIALVMWPKNFTATPLGPILNPILILAILYLALRSKQKEILPNG